MAWLLGAAVASSLTAGPVETLPKEAMSISEWAWSSPLIGGGVKTNDEYTDGNIFLTLPVWSSIGRDGKLGGDYMFIEPYTSVGTNGEVASSLGFAYRHLFSREPVPELHHKGGAAFFQEGWFLGASGFVDMLHTQHDNEFWQLGFGLEAGTRYLEVRGNYYVPLTSRQLAERNVTEQTFSSSSTTYQNSGSGASAPTATGNQIVQDVNLTTSAITTTRTTTVRTVTEIFEEGMEGWDAELSALVPWIDQWMDLRLIGGYFSFDNQPFGPQEFGTGKVHGWKAGAELRPVPAVVLSGYWYEDARYTGADWTVGLQLQVPLDKTWKDAFKMRRRHLVEHLAEPVHRQNDAIKVGNTKKQNSTSRSSVSRVTRIVSQTKQHLVLQDDVIFVNNGDATTNGIGEGNDTTGDGTAEKPKATIQAGADIAGANHVSTGRVWNVYTQHNSVTPYFEDVTITESTNFISSAVMIPGMNGTKFGNGVKPVLGGTFTASPSSTMGFLGITGYEIHAAASAAINAINVENLKIVSNKIDNAVGSGISVVTLPDVFSDIAITGNSIDHTGAGAAGLEVSVLGVGPSFGEIEALVAGNRFSGSGGSGMLFNLDDGVACLHLVGNVSTLNAEHGLSLNLANLSDLCLHLEGNQFNTNGGHGLFVKLDTESLATFESFTDTFMGNTGQGVHLESLQSSELYVSVIEQGTVSGNLAGGMDLATATKGFIDLSVVDSLLESSAPAVVHASVGEHFGASVDLALGFFGTTIRGTGNGTATTGILFESPLDGVGALGVFDDTRIEMSGPGVAAGISLVASGTAAPSDPNIGAVIYDSSITAAGATIGLDVKASGSSGLAVDMQNTEVSSGGVGVSVAVSNDAFAAVAITDGSEIGAEGTGVLVDVGGTDGAQILIADSLIASNQASAMSLYEQSGAALDVFASGNSFFTGTTFAAALDFQRAGSTASAVFENNAFMSAVTGLNINNTSADPFEATVTGNAVLSSGVAGIFLFNQGGTMEAIVNGNSVTNTGGTGYLFINLGAALNVNSSPTVLENNTATGASLFFLDGSFGVTGSILLNGATVPLPGTVP